MNLKNWISHQESSLLDFKLKISDEYHIAKTISAFANRNGGKIIVGVMDNHNIVGCKNIEENIYLINKAANIICNPAVSIKMQEIIIDDKSVLKVDVAESDSKPVKVINQNGDLLTYIRVNDHSCIVPEELTDYINKRRSEVTVSNNYSNLLYKNLTIIEISELLKQDISEVSRFLMSLFIIGRLSFYKNGSVYYYKIHSI